MVRNELVRAAYALVCLILGSLQAWDSDVPDGGLLIVLLVSTAIALPPVTLLTPLKPSYFIGSLIVSFLLLLVARLISPMPLPELFLVLLPSGVGLLYIGILASSAQTLDSSK
jgi:hypothetical protein